KVTPADVLRVANKYLVEDQSTTGYFIPKQAGAQNTAAAKANNFVEENGPFYYRHPEDGHVHEERSGSTLSLEQKNNSEITFDET
ncbi:hypothetical protein, partial [Paraburkholderia sp. SIMBA_053]